MEAGLLSPSPTLKQTRKQRRWCQKRPSAFVHRTTSPNSVTYCWTPIVTPTILVMSLKTLRPTYAPVKIHCVQGAPSKHTQVVSILPGIQANKKMCGPTPTSSRPKIKLVAPPPPATASSSAAPWTAGPAAPAKGPGHVPHGMFFCRERRRDGKKRGGTMRNHCFRVLTGESNHSRLP